MKRILLSIFVALFATTALWAYDFKSGDLYYNITSNSTVKVTYQQGSWSSNNYSGLISAVIPESVTYGGTTYRVTSIGESAFYGCSSLTSVTIPNSVTSIGESAFEGCSKLTSITIPNSVTSIGRSAFNSTPWYKNLPDGVVYINNVLYGYRGTMPRNTSITVKDGTVSISSFAFKDRSYLTSITIPSSVTSIGSSAFKGCSSLTSVTIGSSVTSIGSSAFEGCSSLTSVTIGNSVTSIGSSAFEGCSSLTSVTIGNSVTSIGIGAFSGCSKLTSIIWNAKNCADFTDKNTPFYFQWEGSSSNNFDIRAQIKSFTFGDDVERIPNYICYGMDKLTSITIPNRVTSIGYSAFSGCSGLTSVTIPNSVTSIRESAFEDCSGLTSVTIPNNVTSIEIGAFEGCSGLTHVVWNAKSCKDFSHYSSAPFSATDSLITSFTFGDDVEHIPAYLCYGMKSLTSITIPNSVTSIGESAFEDCSGLTSVTIPNSVTSLGSSAFEGCSGLTHVVWNAKSCKDFSHYSSAPFSATDSLITSFTFGDDVEHIPAYLCYGMKSLTSITIPNSVTSIGESAFEGCSGLTHVVWNAKSCKDFSHYSSAPFSATDSLITSFTFGDDVEHIPAYLCDGMTNLTSVTIPNSVTNIGESAFEGCSGLTHVVWNAKSCKDFSHYSSAPFSATDSLITSFTFGDEVEHIPAYLCDGMTNLTSVTIPNSVTNIGESAFRGCSGLTHVVWNAKSCKDFSSSSYAPFYDSRSQITSFTFGDEVEHIPAYLCYGMKSLTSVTIPNSVTNIKESAFRGCNGLTSVVWEARNCKDFTSSGTPFYESGYSGFDLRSQVTSFVFGDSVQYIPAYLCYEMAGLTSVTIPNSVTSIGGQAFKGCSKLTSVTVPNSVDSIGVNAFGNCNKLASVAWKAKKCTGWDNYQSSPFYSEKGNSITSFTFGKEVKSIPNYLCYEMKNLTSVVIPGSVESIGDEAFKNCRALISVAMGKNVKYIGYRAFDGTYWLNNQRDGLIYMNTVLYGYKGVMPQGTEVVVREGTTEIGHHALSGCKGLTAITIPNSVTNIQDSAFYGCSSLTSATIGSDVARIEQGAFNDCDSLTSVVWNAKHCIGWSNDIAAPFYDARENITSFTLGNEVDSIPAYLCYGMIRLDTITIPENATSIGDLAFYGCNRLTSIKIPNNVVNIGRNAFSDCNNLTSVIWNAKKCSIQSYYSSPFYNDNNYITSFSLGNKVECIPAYLCYEMNHLDSIIIPNSVTEIGENAFSGCDGLKKTIYTGDVAGWYRIMFGNRQSNPINYSHNFFLNNLLVTKLIIPKEIDTINDAFSLDKCLVSITITNGVKSIGSGAFKDCTGLTSVTIPNSVTSIGDYAFYNCSRLTSVTIPNSVMSIGGWAFSNCRGLTSVTIPNSVTSIGGWAFSNCRGLTSVTIPNSVTSIGSGAFGNCSGITFVAIGNSVMSIGDYAFQGCSGLTSVTIPNSVTSIGSGAFYNCSGLTSVTSYATTPPYVQSNTFSNLNVQSIPLYVPLESMPKYNSKDVWKDFLVLPISAMPTDTDDEPILSPEENKVTITWPAIEDAITYIIEISNDDTLVCSLVFDAGGALKNMRYATPARHAAQRATHAETMGYGFRFVVEGLDYATTYTYTITAKDIDDEVLSTYSGIFTTTGDNPATDTEDIRSTQSQSETRKVFRNGQVHIIRSDKTYTLTGEEV